MTKNEILKLQKDANATGTIHWVIVRNKRTILEVDNDFRARAGDTIMRVVWPDNYREIKAVS